MKVNKSNNGEILRRFETVAGRGALRAMARELGFDYNGAQFLTVEGCGKLTPKQFEKDFTAWTGADGVDGFRVILAIRRPRYYGNFEFIIAYYDGEKFRNAENAYFGCRGLNTFYRLSDLDELRKMPLSQWFVFIQHFDEVRPLPVRGSYGRDIINDGERVKVLKEWKSKDSATGAEYVYEVKFQRASGTTGITRPPYSANKKNGDFLDKSGYFVRAYRDKLKRRAEALKAEREKAKADAMDTTAKTAELKTNADRLRETIGRAIAYDVKGARQLERVGKCLSTWGADLVRVYELIENHEKRESENGYKTAKDKVDRLATIEKTIGEIKARFYDAMNAEGVAQ